MGRLEEFEVVESGNLEFIFCLIASCRCHILQES